MSEAELIERLSRHRGQEALNAVAAMLRLRIEKHRDHLERQESDQIRGQLREDRELLKLVE